MDQAPDAAADPEAIKTAVGILTRSGLLHGEPDPLYLEWILWTLQSGVAPTDLPSRARQENVRTDTFDLLRPATIWRMPDGRPFARIPEARTARDLVRLVELLNGGRPSITDGRRTRNRWSYSSFLGWRYGDVELVLDKAEELVATPEGTMMAAVGRKIWRAIPTPADVFSARGGTTWGEMYVLNGSFGSPADVLRTSIESGRTPPGAGAPSLARLLRHERVHSEQWARFGYRRFIVEYLRHSAKPPCRQPLEREAGLEDGGYRCTCGGGCPPAG